MLSKISSYALLGIQGYKVGVEVDVHSGLPGIDMVGLPDTAIKESKDRVRSAIKNSGYDFWTRRITINLAPADTKKEGSFYDLPIAVAILVATEQIDYKKVGDTAFIGELGLDGNLRRVNGVLPMLLSAKQDGIKRIIIPHENIKEAEYVSGIQVFALKSLNEVVNFLSNESAYSAVCVKDITTIADNIQTSNDLKYIKGQAFARRALEIAAAGGHNIILIGPPGGGKTMLAKCLSTILPKMSTAEIFETTKIHSVAGKLGGEEGIIVSRPFRAPHHTASKIALTGGGGNASPGEISLAHNGVLFLDELLEYPRSILEVLRQPLEDKTIYISRAAKSVQYPADFMMIASMNPCPCGNYGSKTKECTCTPAQITKYLSKLSGPLLDRIDLHIEVDGVEYSDLSDKNLSESSEVVRKRVNDARTIQQKRFSGQNVNNNSAMTHQMLLDYCALSEHCEILMSKAFEKLGLSARAYSRILKVARTIADLAASEQIQLEHLTEAISYRSLDRSYYK